MSEVCAALTGRFRIYHSDILTHCDSRQSDRRHEQTRLGSSTSSSIPHTVEYTTHTASDCASPPHSRKQLLIPDTIAPASSDYLPPLRHRTRKTLDRDSSWPSPLCSIRAFAHTHTTPHLHLHPSYISSHSSEPHASPTSRVRRSFPWSLPQLRSQHL